MTIPETPQSGDEPTSRPLPHDRITRRRALTGAGAIAGAGLLGVGLATRPWASAARTTAAGTTAGAGSQPAASPVTSAGSALQAGAAGKGIAVLVTLYGGNDGLNTVVPAADPAYRAGRPDLGYQEGEVLPLADGLGLNPKLAAMGRRWDAKQLAVVRGVGYPDPSLSHFQSMDIWQTAEPTGDGVGWLGRWLDATGHDPMRAISLGASLPPALRGAQQAATAITASSITLPGRAPMLAAFSACAAPGSDRSPLAAAVAGSASDLLSVRSSLASLTGAAQPTPGTTALSTTTLAGQLATIATLINAGAPTQVYQASLGSFDTHADEKANHERLLAELDTALDTFLTEVGKGSRGRDVVVFTVSEFGRRVAQNASGGTDHGTASPLLVAGLGVRGGAFYGDEPSLTSLDAAGNLRYTVDFRSVYATILGKVIGTDPTEVLGAPFPALDFV